MFPRRADRTLSSSHTFNDWANVCFDGCTNSPRRIDRASSSRRAFASGTVHRPNDFDFCKSLRLPVIGSGSE